MANKPRAWEIEWWDMPAPLSGAAQYVSSETTEAPPALLVPDGHGGWREHRPEPKRRPMGFR